MRVTQVLDGIFQHLFFFFGARYEFVAVYSFANKHVFLQRVVVMRKLVLVLVVVGVLSGAVNMLMSLVPPQEQKIITISMLAAFAAVALSSVCSARDTAPLAKRLDALESTMLHSPFALRAGLTTATGKLRTEYSAVHTGFFARIAVTPAWSSLSRVRHRSAGVSMEKIVNAQFELQTSERLSDKSGTFNFTVIKNYIDGSELFYFPLYSALSPTFLGECFKLDGSHCDDESFFHDTLVNFICKDHETVALVGMPSGVEYSTFPLFRFLRAFAERLARGDISLPEECDDLASLGFTHEGGGRWHTFKHQFVSISVAVTPHTIV